MDHHQRREIDAAVIDGQRLVAGSMMREGERLTIVEIELGQRYGAVFSTAPNAPAYTTGMQFSPEVLGASPFGRQHVTQMTANLIAGLIRRCRPI